MTQENQITEQEFLQLTNVLNTTINITNFTILNTYIDNIKQELISITASITSIDAKFSYYYRRDNENKEHSIIINDIILEKPKKLTPDETPDDTPPFFIAKKSNFILATLFFNNSLDPVDNFNFWQEIIYKIDQYKVAQQKWKIFTYDVIFELKKLSFMYTTDNKNNNFIDFQNTLFLGKVSFIDRISETINFNRSIFKKKVLFEKEVLFENKFVFEKEAKFLGCIFEDNVSFKSCIFHKRADFYAVHFNKKNDFSHSYFLGDTDFNHATFNESALFGNTIFRKISFLMATFKKDVNFANINFYTDWSRYTRIKPKADIDLSYSEIKERLNLYNSKINTLILEGSYINNITLSSSTEIENTDSSETWRLLKGFAIKNYNKILAWHYHSREFEAVKKPNDIGNGMLKKNFNTKIIVWFNEISNNHGSSLFLPILWLIFFLFFGAFLEIIALNHLNNFSNGLIFMLISTTFLALPSSFAIESKPYKIITRLFLVPIYLAPLLFFTPSIKITKILEHILNYIPFTLQKKILQDCISAQVIHAIVSIIMAITIWQIIQASRKFKDI